MSAYNIYVSSTNQTKLNAVYDTFGRFDVYGELGLHKGLLSAYVFANESNQE